MTAPILSAGGDSKNAVNTYNRAFLTGTFRSQAACPSLRFRRRRCDRQKRPRHRQLSDWSLETERSAVASKPHPPSRTGAERALWIPSPVRSARCSSQG